MYHQKHIIHLHFKKCFNRFIKSPFLIVTVMVESIASILLLSCLVIGCIAPERKKVNTSVIDENLLLLQRETCTNNSSICPPWTLCDTTTRKCQCGKIPGDPIVYDGVQAKTYIQDCYCVTTVGNKTEIGQCSYNCTNRAKLNRINTIYQQLPSNRSSWNDFMCKEFGRSGTLCGQCDKERNYYPRAYSFDLSCTQCDGSMSSNLWKYITLAYLPLTVFYLLVLFLKLDIYLSQLQGFVIFSQLISAPILARGVLLSAKEVPILFEGARLLLTFCGVWNLDFFRSYDNNICFRISSLNISLLDLGVAVYPLILMLVTYLLVQLYDIDYRPVVLLWKPFKICFDKWYKEFSIKTSLVNSFSTFLFLANSKLFNIGQDILTPVKVYQFNTPNQINTTLRVYYDSTVEYFSLEHTLHSIIALVMSIVIIFPVLLALFYPLNIFQKFLSLFPLRWQLSLHIFFDSFLGSYKDGTEPGARDYRWFGPMLYFIRIIFLVVFAFTLDYTFFLFAAIITTLLALFIINADPFKPHLKHLATNMVVFTLLSNTSQVFFVGWIVDRKRSKTISLYTLYVFAAVVGLLPIFYIAYIVWLWIVRHYKLKVCRK